jgi:hypothetical protein
VIRSDDVSCKLVARDAFLCTVPTVCFVECLQDAVEGRLVIEAMLHYLDKRQLWTRNEGLANALLRRLNQVGMQSSDGSSLKQYGILP